MQFDRHIRYRRQQQHPRQQQQSRRGGRGQPEDRHGRRRHGTDQRQGLHAVLVRPRHAHHVQLQRHLRDQLAAGQGPATAPGVTGTFGTIKRADGSVQATFDGHPLYAFAGDTAPGQNKGNGLNAAGGLWHQITTSGSAAPAPASTSAGSGGGGTGY